MDKIQLQFMVDPDVLLTKVEVPDPVRIVFTDPEKIFALGLLGESGREFVKHGCTFIFTSKLAEKYIEWNIAKEVV
jgi:hypothetical protein